MLSSRARWIAATMVVLAGCAAQRAMVIDDTPSGRVDPWSGWGPPPVCGAPDQTSPRWVTEIDPRGLSFGGAAVVLTPDALETFLADREPGSLPSFDSETQALVLVHAGCDAGPPRLSHVDGAVTVVLTCLQYCGGMARASDAAYALVLPRGQAQHARLALCQDPDPPRCDGPPRP